MTARLAGGSAREALAWGLVVLAAAALRLPGLGDAPLSRQEASSAVLSWQAARGQGALQPSDPAWSHASPLLASAELVLFALQGGGGETTARLPSWLAGLALVLLPLALRRRLGAPTSLALAALLALDPACVEASRRADGVAIAALLATASLVARPGGPVAAACLGLLLVSGAAAWTLLPVVALASLLDRGRRSAAHGVRKRAGIAVTAALIGASGLLGAWELVGGVSSSLTTWLGAWRSADPLAPSPAPLLASVTPLALGIGAMGLVRLWRTRRMALLLVLGASLSWTLGAALRPAGDPAAALLAVLLLAAAAIPAVADLQERWAALPRPWAAAMLGLLATLALPGLVRAARIPSSPSRDPTPAGPPGVRLLAGDVTRLSWQRAGDAHELPVEVLCQPRPDPLLRWTLREVRHLRFHSGSLEPGDSGPALVVGPESHASREAPCQAPGGRAGARYQVGAVPLVLWVPHEG